MGITSSEVAGYIVEHKEIGNVSVADDDEEESNDEEEEEEDENDSED